MLTCQDNDPNVWVIPCISEAPRHLHDYKHHKRDQLRSSDIELNILEDMLQFALSCVWLQVPPVVADWMLTCPGCKCIACLWPVDGDLQPKPSCRLEQLLLPPPCNSCCHG